MVPVNREGVRFSILNSRYALNATMLDQTPASHDVKKENVLCLLEEWATEARLRSQNFSVLRGQAKALRGAEVLYPVGLIGGVSCRPVGMRRDRKMHCDIQTLGIRSCCSAGVFRPDWYPLKGNEDSLRHE